MSFQFALLTFITLVGAAKSIEIVDDDLIGARRPSPILLITGYGGSKLVVRDDSHDVCNTNNEAITVWENATHIANSSECFLKQFTLNYTDGRYLDAPGVTVSTTDFGKLSSSADLSLLLPEFTENDANFVEYFVERGYTIDVNIRAAPYDWRLGGAELRERGYYANVKQLVEQMYEENGNTKVTLLAISMGGPVSHYFLTQVVDQEWKDTFIHAYITLAAVWSGANGLNAVLTPAPVQLFLSAYEIQASVEELRDLSRTFASTYFLIPHESVWNDIVLVRTPTKNYTASNYQELFADVGYPQGYTQISQNNFDFSAPNVPMYCFYGLGFPTVETFVYDAGFPDTQPDIIFQDGDFIVPKPSLEVCQRWADSGYAFNRTVFHGLDHFTIISNLAVLNAMREVVGAPESPIDVCKLPVETGPCRTTIPRYFFNSEKGTCEEFSYGGCGGNSNNFETLESCNQQCNPNDCPPLCTKDYCTSADNRRSLCTLPTMDQQGDCSAKCRITYCHTCYYGDEHRSNPGDCDTCPYYPEVRQSGNRCFKRWAVCTRRANVQLYSKARGKKEKTQERFKCYEHPCIA